MRWLAACGVLCALSAFGNEELVRNPFWPQGYEGLRYPITTEPRIRPKPREAPAAVRKEVKDGRALMDAAEQARENARRAENERRWQAARSTLTFGSTMGFRAPDGSHLSAVTINGRIYAPGDYVSRNCDGQRFTWKIEDISQEGKLKLRRVKCGAVATEHKP